MTHITITQHEADLLRYAAWFHDVGYINSWEGHEERGAQIAQTYLLENGVAHDDVRIVMSLILATKLDYVPENDLECILKDADFAHFSDDNYVETSNLLKKEIEQLCDKSFTQLEWLEQNRDIMLYKHRYYTSYTQQNWQPTKQKNLLDVLDKIEKINTKKKKKEKVESNRTIDTLFRTTLRNHTSLSAIADRKANILLSVNAIIISICLSTLIPKLDSPSNAHLIMPTFVLLIFSVATIIFAIQSTRPKFTSGKFTKEQVKNKEVNLLFFGTFHQMPFDEYEEAINEIMQDKQYLHHALIKDLYSLGVVLNKKYKFLRITYAVFTLGILLSVVAFTLAFRGIGL